MKPYFDQFEDRLPPEYPVMTSHRAMAWQFLAGLTVGVSLWYLYWRWTESLNPDALWFSVLVATAETLFFVGTLIFFHDIWDERDTPIGPPPSLRSDFGEDGDGPTVVDVFITTCDEDLTVVYPTIEDALSVDVPENIETKIWILDDGNRAAFAQMARDLGVGYLARQSNRGFKAGNLKNALLQTQGDFIVICDADTRMFPQFLGNTLGYFRDQSVAWVQTPHWFYDIPEGVTWQNWVAQKLPDWMPRRCVSMTANVLQFIVGSPTKGADPMLSEPAVFFDVIQRRRNRNGASFCCGAGSVHRREALFESSLKRFGAAWTAASPAGKSKIDFEPFKFHVSEDIYTSILLHSDAEKRWKSVYHPHVECRMLSPWTMEAWATQKLKYAGGTFDIMMRDNPVFRAGMPWRVKLHYLATFWSYLSVLWIPIMMFAPVFSILTGWAPVEAYSLEFFLHILPVLILSELAMVVGCKGHNINIGRVMSVGALPITMRALGLVLSGQKPKFPATPKTPVFHGDRFGRVTHNLIILAVMVLSIAYGFWAYAMGFEGYSPSFLIVNVFWIFWNMMAHVRIVSIAAWRPPNMGDVTPSVTNSAPFLPKERGQNAAY